jgi:EpsD family peptidyl-prolyl cis-trans isomerase
MVLTFSLAACGDKLEDSKPASQVAAKVNSREISIHQVNFLLERMPGLTPEKTSEAKGQALDNLVDQELAVQQALEAKLDRNPKVMQTMEAARREILARAYMEQAVAGKPKPSAEEVKAYYREHPELFAERKIYRVQEISFPAKPETVAAVREQAERAKHGDELLNSLRSRGIQAAASIFVKPAENIPLEMLPRLSQMKEGQSGIFENGDQAALVTVIKAAPEPLSEEAARPIIEQFLTRRQNAELVKTTVRRLREQAKIEYVGEFGKEALAARQAREAEETREAQEAKKARETARLAQEAESAKRAEEMRKRRQAAEAERSQAPSRLPAPPEDTISKGLSTLK